MPYRVPLFFLVTILLMTASVRLAMAQGGCETPTITDEAIISSGWPEWPEWHVKLKIHSEKETITRNEGIDLWCVLEGGAPCPPFTWTLSGTGFYFGSISGPTTAITHEELEIVELWADNTACGSAIISITDSCGVTGAGHVRGDVGQWVTVEIIHQSDWWSPGSYCPWPPVGNQRYLLGTRGSIYTPISCNNWFAELILSGEYGDPAEVSALCSAANRFRSCGHSVRYYTLRRQDWQCP